jgi:hypothetical protein
LLDGYDGVVGTDDCDADGETEGGEVGDGCAGDPGAGGGATPTCNRNTVSGALNCLKSTASDIKEPIFIVIFDTANCTPRGPGNPPPGGGGNNCTFHVIDFVGVRLWGFDITAGDARRYLDLEFIEATGSGICCSSARTNVRVLEICAVDHDSRPIGGTDRCAQ